MPNYKTEKYIYHITALENIPSILMSGLRSRSDLKSGDFNDVASDSILNKRAEYGLDKFVPFHWVYGSEFDYSIHENNEDTEFVYIAIDRDVAKNENWKVIPQHPLAGGKAPEILDYSNGLNKIHWNYMKPHYQYYEGLYNYQNQLTTMAECLSPKSVPVSKFAKILVADEEVVSYIFDFFDGNISANDIYLAKEEDDFPLYELQKNQSANDDLCDLEITLANFPIDLFEVRPDMFKYYE